MTDTMSLTELFNFKSKKEENGKINSLRENKFVQEINKEKSEDPIIIQLMGQINKFDIKKIKKCVQKGGCQNSHDFELECDVMSEKNEQTDTKKFNVELKVSSTGKLAQLSDIYLKNHDGSIISEEFSLFVDGWYSKLKEIKKEFNIESELSKKEIKDFICKVPKKNHTNSDFIEDLKEIIRANSSKKKKLDTVTKKYISDYLESNFKSINKQAILELYKSKLNCKDLIIIYNQKKEKITLVKNDGEQKEVLLDKVNLLKSKDGKMNVGLKIDFKFVSGTNENKKEQIKSTTIRLRFKNGTGLYGVAWQLGYFN